MNTPTLFTATITGVAITITRSEVAYSDGRDWTSPRTITTTRATETRPVDLAAADTFLAVHSLTRTDPWDLDSNGGVTAPLTAIENAFCGTVAARLWDAVGTTHTQFELAAANTVVDGDLVSDPELSAVYVVAGSCPSGNGAKLHMVGEGGTWDTRHTTVFEGLIQVARRKA